MGELASDRLPVHGFVLAGGKSSRMGVDKALLPFCGRPMVEIAVEKLRGFCAEVGIAGNREELSGFAPVVRETRVEIGPAAGVEAGLMSAREPWVLFVPVDAPMVPEQLLRRWVQAVVHREGCAVSYLMVNETRQPAFCAMRRECGGKVAAEIEGGERRLARIFHKIGEDAELGGLWEVDAGAFSAGSTASCVEMERWFANVNTPEELAEAEAFAQGQAFGR